MNFTARVAHPFSTVARKVRYFLAVSQTSASASPENNRQPEQDDCDRHKRRAGDVSDQDEEDGDNGEDCSDVVVHSFYILGLRRYGVSQRRADCAGGGSGRVEYDDSNPLVENKDPAPPLQLGEEVLWIHSARLTNCSSRQQFYLDRRDLKSGVQSPKQAVKVANVDVNQAVCDSLPWCSGAAVAA